MTPNLAVISSQQQLPDVNKRRNFLSANVPTCNGAPNALQITRNPRSKADITQSNTSVTTSSERIVPVFTSKVPSSVIRARENAAGVDGAVTKPLSNTLQPGTVTKPVFTPATSRAFTAADTPSTPAVKPAFDKAGFTKQSATNTGKPQPAVRAPAKPSSNPSSSRVTGVERKQTIGDGCKTTSEMHSVITKSTSAFLRGINGTNYTAGQTKSSKSVTGPSWCPAVSTTGVSRLVSNLAMSTSEKLQIQAPANCPSSSHVLPVQQCSAGASSALFSVSDEVGLTLDYTSSQQTIQSLNSHSQKYAVTASKQLTTPIRHQTTDAAAFHKRKLQVWLSCTLTVIFNINIYLD